mmetsp:Transcript_120918/g.349359  ORF Transcript_120918/g.349359 Transcript_120918/m.349359 type:complete len:265 (-) Transcript_120918:299-1093(-)
MAPPVPLPVQPSEDRQSRAAGAAVALAELGIHVGELLAIAAGDGDVRQLLDVGRDVDVDDRRLTSPSHHHQGPRPAQEFVRRAAERARGGPLGEAGLALHGRRRATRLGRGDLFRRCLRLLGTLAVLPRPGEVPRLAPVFPRLAILGRSLRSDRSFPLPEEFELRGLQPQIRLLLLLQELEDFHAQVLGDAVEVFVRVFELFSTPDPVTQGQPLQPDGAPHLPLRGRVGDSAASLLTLLAKPQCEKHEDDAIQHRRAVQRLHHR